MKRIVLCADDYGQAPAISRGILDLVKCGRLSAVSCMVNTPFWDEHGLDLRPFWGKIDIGLHFNLTEGKPLSGAFSAVYGEEFLGLARLFSAILSGRLQQKVIEAELLAQLNAFEKVLGSPPDFVDGHQHIHQFLHIREALLNVYNERLRTKNTYIRLVSGPLKLRDFYKNIKKVIIAFLGANVFKKRLNEEKIPHNQSFSGMYNFNQAACYETYFPRFLAESADGGLIMCHPGHKGEELHDAIKTARVHEFDYFISEKFLTDCAKAGVVLGRL